MIEFTIDGVGVEGEEGSTVLPVALENGFDIPHLCYHDEVKPYGACRLCLVEVEKGGRRRLTASCTYPVLEGIQVFTSTEEVQRARRVIIELLLTRCPDREALQELASQMGVEKPPDKIVQGEEKMLYRYCGGSRAIGLGHRPDCSGGGNMLQNHLQPGKCPADLPEHRQEGLFPVQHRCRRIFPVNAENGTGILHRRQGTLNLPPVGKASGTVGGGSVGIIFPCRHTRGGQSPDIGLRGPGHQPEGGEHFQTRCGILGTAAIFENLPGRYQGRRRVGHGQDPAEGRGMGPCIGRHGIPLPQVNVPVIRPGEGENQSSSPQAIRPFLSI